MKRVAALYDIHANLPALEAVLREVRDAGVDRVVIGGDVVPGPMPRETIECLQDLDLPLECIRGNGERELIAIRHGSEAAAVPEAYRDAVRWVAAELTAADEQWLSSWPLTRRLAIDGRGDVLFCHATPRNDFEIFTRHTPADRLQPVFADVAAPVVVCGHTHMPFDRTVGTTRVVNAGSVGMPFGAPGAYWLLLGPDIELRRTSYDFADAAARVRRTSYPLAESFAAGNIVQPPSEAEMLAVFDKAALT